MKSPFPKKPAPVDEEIVRDDEIDELMDGQEEVTDSESASALFERIAEIEAQLQEAQDARLRALADYQNVQRRAQSERAAWSKLATQDLVTSILEPLEHLQLAAAQLSDPGLSMVVKQLFDRLEEQGLQKIDVLGKPFDETTMEAIKGSHPEGKKITHVISNGYTLHGVLIQVAKVKVG